MIVVIRDGKNLSEGWSPTLTGGDFGVKRVSVRGSPNLKNPRRVWGGDGIDVPIVPIPEPDPKIYMFGIWGGYGGLSPDGNRDGDSPKPIKWGWVQGQGRGWRVGTEMVLSYPASTRPVIIPGPYPTRYHP
ncbi:Hypothetical predicted protein [Prunus dulcis]|uniref:Uncharacterized protein n=1 Tax=Prunus dulcis TaxID=3755 RepID=A0A5E4FGA2_PRUDU|nr:Hypothetical predicted protein [Prunus dulcis]